MTFEVREKGRDCIGHYQDCLIRSFADAKEAIRYSRVLAQEEHKRTKGERGRFEIYVRAAKEKHSGT